ncbi:MAG: transposase [Acidobacteria bacterium]|nr:transposase [Acidobacteriota bacterium]
MKAYKYKLKPSAKIVAIFESWLAICCELYNAALQERRDAYQINHLSINYLAQANQLPEIKTERPDLARIHSQVVQNVLMRVAFAFDNFFRRAERDLKRAGRRVSRRIKGGKRQKKAVRMLAKKHLKVKRQRRDFHFKEARKLVAQYQSIKVEDLNIKGMVKNNHLAKSISDAGWGQFIMIIINKAEEAGREVIKVNPSYTSQDCSRCGHRNRITLATRIYRCSKCDLVIHRDRNGAKRIEQKGRAVPSGSRRDVACEEPRTSQATDLESPAITR